MSDTKRKIFIVVVLVLVLLFGVGQFFAGSGVPAPTQPTTPAAPANSQVTQVIAFTPPALASSTPVEEGSCFASSVAAPYRTDAWRCTVGNAINDPCFQIPSATGIAENGVGSTLLCGANPASTDLSSMFVLKLTKALPKATMPSGAVPANWAWSVELADGVICTPFTGTRPFDASGDVGTYACNGPATSEAMIFGDLNTASTTWTAEVGALSASTSTFPPPIVASATIPVFAVWQ